MSKLTPGASAPSFPTLVQAFFAEHLTQQRALSPRTVATYRDAFVLFLDFVQVHCAKAPTAITLADLTPKLILAFLDHLERKRHNAVRSRNARLAALRSFLKFAAHRDPSSLNVIERALGVPSKRFERPMLGFLSNPQMRAIIGVPDNTWTSRRDHLLLGLLYNTGARVSETSSPCASPTSYSTAPPAYTCTARVANSVRSRCGVRSSKRPARGSSTTRGSPRNARCCPIATECQ